LISAVTIHGLTNARSEFLLTTLPIVALGETSSGGVVIPHFADGGGWTTQIRLINPGDAIVTGTAEFMDPLGQRIRIAPFSAAPRSFARIDTSGLSAGIQTGSVRISAGLGAISIFSFQAGGTTVTQAAVQAAPSGTAFQSYVETSGSLRSGLAIANPSSSAITVSLDLLGATARLNIPANGQRSFFLKELPEFANLATSFQGVVRITGPTAVAVTGLRGRTNERGEFLISAMPPADESAVPASTELLFPQLADGGGYDTELVLFGRSTSGTIYFFTEMGQPLNLTLQ
jgi:hypothetical protein